MRKIYRENTANYPRLSADVFFTDYGNEFKFEGFLDKTIKYVESFQSLDAGLWESFVDLFREEDADAEGGWRGEFWGKTMRGAAFVYSYTKNKELYDVMKKTVCDILDTQDSMGRISTYAVNHEFEAWDVWGRKYVLLGMQYFLEVCTEDELCSRIVKSMCAQVDYIMTKIGPKEEGKKPITSATRHWRGLNSSSILEPVVRLYSITQDRKYLDFAKYIVDAGGMDVANVFTLAYENKLKLHQYPATKAYEMTSCFEGLLEYYRITREERYKTSIINFANAILEDEFTIIGTSGCTHELFDHSKVRQANTTNGVIAQETCVTVTLMKFFWQLNLLTGDSRYADAFETSLYNAYLGAVNTDKVTEKCMMEMHPNLKFKPLPFDSYSPLTAGTRGNGIGGFRPFGDGNYYGCCACIGAAGLGLAAKMALLTSENGFVLNLYINGTIESISPLGRKIKFITDTEYPKYGSINIKLVMDNAEDFTLMLRNPAWSKNTSVSVNGEPFKAEDGYIHINRTWHSGDTVEISLDMRTEAIYPVPYGSQVLMNEVIWGYNYVIPSYDEEDPIAKNHIALRRGPVILAQENRLGYSVDDPVTIITDENGYVDVRIPDKDTAPYEHIVEVGVPTDEGYMTLTDYSSAGKKWTEESKMAAWILTK